MRRGAARHDPREAIRLLEVIRHRALTFRAGDWPEERGEAGHAGIMIGNCLLGRDGVERPRFQKLRSPVSPGRATRGPVMAIPTDNHEIGSRRLLVTYIEAAAALAVSPRYLRTLVYQGAIPAVRLGRLRRIAVEDLQSFVGALRDRSSG